MNVRNKKEKCVDSREKVCHYPHTFLDSETAGGHMGEVCQEILRQQIAATLVRQGYSVTPDGVFLERNGERDGRRRAHMLAKAERVSQQEKFILDNLALVSGHLVDGKNLDVERIEPELREVEPGTRLESIFRWWNIVWWSLPYERAYGRQMRFVVWDRHHDAPIGLIGLQSPILSWAPRDKHLGIAPKDRDYWVNQSLSAQRIGALPPYNDILGGKLVTLLMTSNVIRKRFQEKYAHAKTVMQGRTLPANLLFITTTGAYGKSSIYNRLKFNDSPVAKFIGYTKGCGTFHIPNTLYEDMLSFLKCMGIDTRRGYGSGPSRKLRLIDEALGRLGFTNGVTHGVQRALYLFPLAQNLLKVIEGFEKPEWHDRSPEALTLHWRQRWLPKRRAPRVGKPHYRDFSRTQFIDRALSELAQQKALAG